MRQKLLHPLRERSHERAERRGHQRRRAAAPEQVPAPAPSGGCDPALEQVRRAGGPIDQAVYTCGCGYLFSAAVSTTVSCPHCGTDQAW